MNTKTKKTSDRRKATKSLPLSLTARNYQIFAIAILFLVAGYIIMSIGPAEGVLSLTLAPIILIVVYCVLIPLAIIWKPSNKKADS